jgi:hypothetical protein
MGLGATHGDGVEGQEQVFEDYYQSRWVVVPKRQH